MNSGTNGLLVGFLEPVSSLSGSGQTKLTLHDRPPFEGYNKTLPGIQRASNMDSPFVWTHRILKDPKS